MPAGRPRQFDEADILERATLLFWRNGYRSMGMSDLVESLGIGRQSLYDTFGSKKELYLKCIHHYRASRLSQVLDLLEATDDPLQAVKRAVQYFEKLALAKSARGCLVANALIECGSGDEEISELLEDTLQLLEQGLLIALKRAKKLGQLGETKKPHQLAKALTNASIGMAVTSRLSTDERSIRAAYAGTLAMLG